MRIHDGWIHWQAAHHTKRDQQALSAEVTEEECSQRMESEPDQSLDTNTSSQEL